jgi:hypothetical protein
METSHPPKKVTKTKARLSLGLSRTLPSTVTETPSDVNGEKEVEQEENVTENNKEVVEEDSTKKAEPAKVNTVPQGKKHKLDETKETDAQSEDSNNAFHGFAGEQESNVEKDTASTNEEKQDNKTLPKIPDPVPPESAFGKGERSRIPNEKYESLGIKTFGQSYLPVGLEHGELVGSDDNTDNGVSKLNSIEVKEESDVKSSAHSSPSVGAILSQKAAGLSTIGSPGTPHSKKQKLAVDLTNPLNLISLEHGWVRELVYRANLEIKEHILDIAFFKEPLGLNDPEKEIIRDVKMKGGGTPGSAKKSTPKTLKTPKERLTSPKVPTPLSGANYSGAMSPKAGKSPMLGGAFKGVDVF